MVRGELEPDTVATVEALATVRYVEPLYFDNVHSKRCVLAVRPTCRSGLVAVVNAHLAASLPVHAEHPMCIVHMLLNASSTWFYSVSGWTRALKLAIER